MNKIKKVEILTNILCLLDEQKVIKINEANLWYDLQTNRYIYEKHTKNGVVVYSEQELKALIINWDYPIYLCKK